MRILITGANGYIGSCLFAFLKMKYKNVFGLDKKIDRVQTGITKCNLLDTKKIKKLINSIKPTHIVHLAGESLVDSTIDKNKYYLNNVVATRNISAIAEQLKVSKIIFSSTAAVYKPNNKKLKENSKIYPISNYAKSKLQCEKIIKKTKTNSIIFRFFNVCSSLKKHGLGELHRPETHLIPTLLYKIIFKNLFYLYGNNYKTKDGTCIRDYVHIEDICSAIEKSLSYKMKNKSIVFNLGNGDGFSVLQIIKNSEKFLTMKAKVLASKAREGDVARLVCDNKKAGKYLKWIPKKSSLKNIIENEVFWIKKFSKQGIKRIFKNYL
tara:strand:- start:64 stop:1032 length:969 start_codon:yes stop_codon:yes gene_type:complete